MLTNSNKKDIEVLIEQFASTDLPNIFGEYFENIDDVIDKIKNSQIPIYTGSDLYYYVDDSFYFLKNSNSTEPIRYFSFKKNAAKRLMGIPNPVLYLVFIVNALIAHENWILEFYKNQSDANLLLVSNSPIIGRSHYQKLEYDKFSSEITIKRILSGYTNELTRKKSKSFAKNEEKSFLIEGAKPYFLRLDIENFYSNISLNLIKNLYEENPFKELSKNNPEIKDFFNFLYKFNAEINDNLTKGIITGPISSFITAEFFSIAIDYTIYNDLSSFVRYVDDYTAYAYSQTELEKFVEIFDRILSRKGLNRKFEKTEINKGFFSENKADLVEIVNRFKYLNPWC